ncbi:MAG: glycosyltransferase family 4 protein, partial [Bacillota bacterium]|nr:glycosyltransferase family 4 protein [Bacillota bacterium]
MKKVLQIIAQKPGNTGSGIFLQSLVKEMYKKGYNQAVVAGISKNDKIKLIKDKKISFYPVYFETDELPSKVVGMSDVMPYESTKYTDMNEQMLIQWEKAFKKVIKVAVEKFKPDIILSHHLWMLTALVKKWYPNIPMIGICHGTDLRQLEKSKEYSAEVIKECRNIETVFALNNFQKEKIHKKYGIEKNKIFTMGSAYNSDVFYSNIEKKENKLINLVYAGKLSYSKGVMHLVNAYDEIISINKNLNLIIVGSGKGEESDNIKKTGENINKNINKNIEFTGMVSQYELGDIFRKSDIFVLPSFYEG